MVTVDWFGEFGVRDLRVDEDESSVESLGLVVFYGSWNAVRFGEEAREVLTDLLPQATAGLHINRYAGHFRVDACDETTEYLVGNGPFAGNSDMVDSPPMSLPCLGIVCTNKRTKKVVIKYMKGVSSSQLMKCLSMEAPESSVLEELRNAVYQVEDQCDLLVEAHARQTALRIFVAGDRSSVGKSSACLGILGNLLASGYAASDLAYIKPATQSESTQLIETYCRRHKVRCVPIGPLVYYRGFTRAFLAGETESTENLLAMCGRAVDRVSRYRKIVLIDGVGFPAVGSICGTDNAQVLRACSVQKSKPTGVVLIGGVGVGGAVDAYNLNATYFQSAHIPVLGAIFNKLPTEGFYSLESCRTQVTSYFEQFGKGKKAFGFVPLYKEIAGPNAMDRVDDFLAAFSHHVDIEGLIKAARQVCGPGKSQSPEDPPIKRARLSERAPPSRRSRSEIESQAIGAGAQKSA